MHSSPWTRPISLRFSRMSPLKMWLTLRLMGLVHGLLCITLFSYWLMSRTYRMNDRDIGGEPEVRTVVELFADLVVMVVGFLIAFIGWNGAFFGRIIKGAVSRQREFLADAAAVQCTRYPEGLANALKKVKESPEGSIIHSPRAEEASHIFFCNGIEDDRIRLTSTHPPLDERIGRIETMMGPGLAPGPKAITPFDEDRAADRPGVERFIGRSRVSRDSAAESSTTVAIDAKDALADVGVPVARHLVYAAKLMETLPEPVRRAAREPRGATALVYALLLSRVESAREAQLRLLKSRLSSEASLRLNSLLATARDWNEHVKVPLVELTFPALRRMSLLEYTAFMENTAALIRVDQQVDLFEFALQKMLRRHLEPKFRPVPKPEARYSAVTELAVACSTLLSALAHAGQDSMKEAQAAFERGVKNLNHDGVRFMTQAECTLSAAEAALDSLSEAASPLKKPFLDACAQIVAADGRIQAREAELLRAIADSLDCPIPPFVSVEVGKTK